MSGKVFICILNERKSASCIHIQDLLQGSFITLVIKDSVVELTNNRTSKFYGVLEIRNRLTAVEAALKNESTFLNVTYLVIKESHTVLFEGPDSDSPLHVLFWYLQYFYVR